MGAFIKRFLPRSLLGRSLLIIVAPLVLLQMISGTIFYQSHWDKVSLRLARGLAGDVASVISLMRRYPDGQQWIFDLARNHFQVKASVLPGAILPNYPPKGSGLLERTLIEALRSQLDNPFQIDSESIDRHVIIWVQSGDSVLELVTPRKRLFSSTTYVFVMWMIGVSIILFAVATIFMRNQVRPISKLAKAADAFGKGREVDHFKPEGASEVRRAATAFLAMRERIFRQISQRTDMLAGVSHDLRTPLTRMKLQIALMDVKDGAKELEADIADMERMLEGYLAFARGEGIEKPVAVNLTVMLGEIAARARREGGAIDLHCEGQIIAQVRPNAFKRCVTNLVENAVRYAQHVSVRLGSRKGRVEITIDDDGPGIAQEARGDVFKPFFRIEGSRNPETGGVGLGLTIARDVARSQGGDVELLDSPNGGLRVKVRTPL